MSSLVDWTTSAALDRPVEQEPRGRVVDRPAAARHVVFVHQTYSTANAEGSGRANAIAEAMVRAGYRVSIVAGANSYLTGDVPPQYRGRWLVTEQCDGYTVYRPWTYARLHKSFLHRAIYFLVYMLTSAWTLLRVPRFDVIVGCSPPITVAIAAYAAAVLRRATFVLEVRDLWPAFPIQMGIIRNPLIIACSRLVERILYRNARVVVINSPGFREHVTAHGVEHGRLRLVPNGVDVSVFRPLVPDPDLRRDLGLEGKFVVLYIGAHGQANSLDTLLDAAALLRDEPRVHIMLIGGGKQKPELEARARRGGLRNVTFLAPQPKHDIPRYIAIADLCYASLQNIPMFTTTYPNKVFDYLACGKPTLTTIDGVSREVLEQAGAGMYASHDGSRVAECIRWAMTNREELERMGQRARAVAVRDWDRSRFAEEFAQLAAQVSA